MPAKENIQVVESSHEGLELPVVDLPKPASVTDHKEHTDGHPETDGHDEHQPA